MLHSYMLVEAKETAAHVAIESSQVVRAWPGSLTTTWVELTTQKWEHLEVPYAQFINDLNEPTEALYAQLTGIVQNLKKMATKP